MMKVKIYKLDSIDDALIKYVVILVKHKGQWVLSKHKERNTWEFAGGHREINESLMKLQLGNYGKKQGQKIFC
ncbi:8-oxo-dGTP diphosphatase [Fontibacillus solani]|uniref:8-oxo-dGTP diphosphatase n=1 Tax=Fontibacillus solani TaxID=1572857 RepID=A0A7W3SYR9_9BACL|nr:hypothetical protein [Fontibacillus solani]MBA9088619.1 8-oxo-dGTP diphosphatase [Fontibacillus solani]